MATPWCSGPARPALLRVSHRLTDVSQSSTSRHMAGPTMRRDDAEQTADETAEERKERVLHTRVPDSLDKHLKRRARTLGMSVSTVVRNVLLTTFGLVEDIVNDGTDIALAVTGQEA